MSRKKAVEYSETYTVEAAELDDGLLAPEDPEDYAAAEIPIIPKKKIKTMTENSEAIIPAKTSKKKKSKKSKSHSSEEGQNSSRDFAEMAKIPARGRGKKPEATAESLQRAATTRGGRMIYTDDVGVNEETVLLYYRPYSDMISEAIDLKLFFSNGELSTRADVIRNIFATRYGKVVEYDPAPDNKNIRVRHFPVVLMGKMNDEYADYLEKVAERNKNLAPEEKEKVLSKNEWITQVPMSDGLAAELKIIEMGLSRDEWGERFKESMGVTEEDSMVDRKPIAIEPLDVHQKKVELKRKIASIPADVFIQNFDAIDNFISTYAGAGLR